MPDDPKSQLLNIHLSEYQVLTNKATYFIVISAALWPVIGLYLTVVATLWSRFAGNPYWLSGVIWLSAVVVQVTLFVWTNLLWDQFTIVLYIETRLRPLIRGLAPGRCFWLYEPFLTQRRKSSSLQSAMWETSVAWGMIAAIVLAAVVRAFHFRDLTVLDYLGFITNAALVPFLYWRCHVVGEIRREWERSHAEIIEECLLEKPAG